MPNSNRNRDSKILVAGQIISGILSLLSIVVTAKIVGSDFFAFCSTLLSILIVTMSFVDFGSCSWASRELAAKSITASDYLAILKRKSRLSLIFFLPFPLLFFGTSPNFMWAWVLLCYPALWIRYNYYQQFLIANGRFKTSQSIAVIDRLCWLSVVPLHSIGLDKALVFSIPIILGLVCHNLICSQFLIKTGSNERRTFKYKQREIYGKSRFFGIISTAGIVGNLDGLVATSILTLSDAGTYVLNQRFRIPLSIFFNAISIKMKPIASEKNYARIIKSLKDDTNLLFVSICSSIGVSIIFLLYADVLFGSSFQNINEIMFLGALTSIPVGFTLIATSILSGIGEEVFVSKGNLINSTALLLAVACGSTFLGSLGASMAVLLVFSLYAVAVVSRCFEKLNNLKEMQNGS